MRHAIKTWAEIEAWKPWFAWYPVQIKLSDGTYQEVFGEWIERRTPYLKNAGIGLNGPLPPEYRLKE